MSDTTKGKGRMVNTNVRVTKETHLELKVLADLRGQPISEAISSLIREAAPDVIQEVKRREEASKKHTGRKVQD